MEVAIIFVPPDACDALAVPPLPLNLMTTFAYDRNPVTALLKSLIPSGLTDR